MGDISLQIRHKVFQVKKETLCEYSDYFRAMFSGNYVEDQLNVITIDMLDPKIMNIVLKYMDRGVIYLNEYSLADIGEIAVVANFLQITKLIKQIEYVLEIQLCDSNWMEIMALAENCSYSKIEQYSAAYGLYSFKRMKPENVPSIHKLAWYLSHPYIDAQRELDVFLFGLKWILNNEMGADALLIILGCLDFKRTLNLDIVEIRKAISEFENSLASKVVDCMYELSSNELEINESILDEKKNELCEKFTAIVWTETKNIVKESKSRLLKYTPVVPMWLIKNSKPELLPNYMYKYDNDKGFEQWIEVSEKNLWGWSIVAWGLTKLVIVCGEHGRGTGIFMRDVKVYDTLKQEWTTHNVELPPRRHAGVAINGDLLYIIGGVGVFRVVLDSAIIYDLKQRSYRKIAKLPDVMQNPAVCAHNNLVYAAGQKNILRFEDTGVTECWRNIVGTQIRMSCIKSFKGYIYCIQGYFSHLYRFKPDVDHTLELVAYISSLPATLCNIGNNLLVFTRTVCGQSDILAVEQCDDDVKEKKPVVLFKQSNTSLRVNDVVGSCALAMTFPPLYRELSQYHYKYLTRYSESN